MKKPRFLLAAPSSHSGKTTITLAILRALTQKNYKVQPFKCGPDYLDTYLHAMAASRPNQKCYGLNLDTYLSGKEHVRQIFWQYASQADVAIAEGVMGLFDGAQKSRGSSAEIAMLLDLPVVLVVDARHVAYSVAPLLYGYKHFEPKLNLLGVIFNNVNKPSHYQFLKEACEDVGVASFGYVPQNEEIKIKERHLGLNISREYDRERMIDNMAAHVQATVELEHILRLSTGEIAECPLENTSVEVKPGPYKIAVASDDAFNFIYKPNLDRLATFGELVFFSPLKDQQLPEADLLYLAGGYPELFVRELSENNAMRAQIKRHCESNRLCYAECGGLMYLGQTITTASGSSYEMCGALALRTTMQNARLSLGYRTLRLNDSNCREVMRGHEFHYSRIEEGGLLESVARVENARQNKVETALYRHKNTFASYVHQYWGETSAFIEYLFHQVSAETN